MSSPPAPEQLVRAGPAEEEVVEGRADHPLDVGANRVIRARSVVSRAAERHGHPARARGVVDEIAARAAHDLARAGAAHEPVVALAARHDLHVGLHVVALPRGAVVRAAVGAQVQRGGARGVVGAVEPGAASEHVGAGAAVEHVVVEPAAEDVGALPAEQQVEAVGARQHVVALAAAQLVVEGAAVKTVGTVPSVELVAPVAAQKHVVACLPHKRVVEPGAVEAVAAITAVQLIAAAGAREDVGARAADEHGTGERGCAQHVGALATVGAQQAARAGRRELVVAGATDQRRTALEVVVPRSAVEHRRHPDARPQRVAALTPDDALDVSRHPVALVRLAAHPARARDDRDGRAARRVAERVDAGTALLIVAARPRGEHVVALDAEQRVVARITAERVPAR